MTTNRRENYAKFLAWTVVTIAVFANGQNINTVAGGGTIVRNPAKADIAGPVAVVTDSQGNLYVAPPAEDYVFELTADGETKVLAGLGWGHYNPNTGGYDGEATKTPVFGSSGLGVDKYNRVYIVDTMNNTIRMVAGGQITTMAGARQGCILANWPNCNDGHNALYAYLSNPQGVVLDSSNNMYIADTGDNVIRYVDHKTKIMSRFAGRYGKPCEDPNSACGDGGAALQASLNSPMGISLYSYGSGKVDVYIADTLDNRIRCVAGVAGGCGVSASEVGNIYNVAGSGTACTPLNDDKHSTPPYCGDGGEAAKANIGAPRGVSVDPATGAYYIADTRANRVRRISGGIIQAYAGAPGLYGYGGDGGLATDALLMTPGGVYVSGGDVFIADTGNQRVREVSNDSGKINTIAGSADSRRAGSGGDFGPAAGGYAMLAGPYSVAVDSSNNYYIADSANNRIRAVNTGSEAQTIAGVKIGPGDIATIAGNGDFDYSGDGGAATKATMENPYGVAVGRSGNIYIADTGIGAIREVDGTTGVISTLAGTKQVLNTPTAVSVDKDECVYVADVGLNKVLKACDGAVSVVAGTGGVCGKGTDACGDGGAAVYATLNGPTGVAVASNGDFYIADSNDNRIRCVLGVEGGCRDSAHKYKVGDIVPAAYNGESGVLTGDGGAATKASRWLPKAVAVDGSENLFIGGGQDFIVQKVNYGTGTISTVAGNYNQQPEFGFTGDGGPATQAELDNMGLAIDGNGNLLIADFNNNRIREVKNVGEGR
jgi:trimeric autotransporter adhesin